jgi:hypothetical protein
MRWILTECVKPDDGGPHSERSLKLRNIWARLLLRPCPKGGVATEMKRRADLFLQHRWRELWQEALDAQAQWVGRPGGRAIDTDREARTCAHYCRHEKLSKATRIASSAGVAECTPEVLLALQPLFPQGAELLDEDALGEFAEDFRMRSCPRKQ